MNKYKNKGYCLRIDENTMNKVKYIAKSQERTANKMIEIILKEYVNKFEGEHGEIMPPED